MKRLMILLVLATPVVCAMEMEIEMQEIKPADGKEQHGLGWKRVVGVVGANGRMVVRVKSIPAPKKQVAKKVSRQKPQRKAPLTEEALSRSTFAQAIEAVAMGLVW